jgi:hypothetical protein
MGVLTKVRGRVNIKSDQSNTKECLVIVNLLPLVLCDGACPSVGIRVGNFAGNDDTTVVTSGGSRVQHGKIDAFLWHEDKLVWDSVGIQTRGG